MFVGVAKPCAQVAELSSLRIDALYEGTSLDAQALLEKINQPDASKLKEHWGHLINAHASLTSFKDDFGTPRVDALVGDLRERFDSDSFKETMDIFGGCRDKVVEFLLVRALVRPLKPKEDRKGVCGKALLTMSELGYGHEPKLSPKLHQLVKSAAEIV